MDRTSFFNEIMPTSFSLTNKAAGTDSLKVYDGKNNKKTKDIIFIKSIAREKVELNGAPIKYFPIDVAQTKSKLSTSDNVLGDHTDVILGPPISMVATWTPQEYQLDLSKWGVMMPTGTDQQLFIHVDELSEKLKRKPLMGDIIETVNDTMRYKVADVFYGNANLWENIFCMVTLSKISYDNYTSQLDKYDSSTEPNYANTYTTLENVLNISSEGIKTSMDKSNDEILKSRTSTYAYKEPAKRSIDTQVDSITDKLNIMTMKL